MCALVYVILECIGVFRDGNVEVFVIWTSSCDVSKGVRVGFRFGTWSFDNCLLF